MLSKRLVTGEDTMKGSFMPLIIAFLFVLSGIAAAYSQCVEGHHRTEVSAEHETPLIHCPDVSLTSNTEIFRLSRGYRDELGKSLVSFSASTKTAPDIAQFRDIIGYKGWSQHDLYSFQEVFRL